MRPATINLVVFLALAATPRTFAQDIMQTNTVVQEQHGVSAIAVSPDGKSLAFADKDNQIVLRPVDGRRRTAVGKHSAAFLSLVFSADGKKIAGLTKDRMVVVWAIGTGQPIAKHKIDKATGLLAFDPDDKVVLAYVANWTEKGMDHAEIRLIDVESAKLRTLAKASTAVGIPGSPANYELLAFSSDGATLAFNKAYISGYFPGLIDIAGKKTLKMPEGVQFDIDTRLAIPGGTPAVLVVRKGQIGVYDSATGKAVRISNGPSSATQIATNGTTLVTVDSNNLVTTYQLLLDARK